MSAATTARDRARVEITRTIQETARRHLGEVGPAALSLRAIAREVGMVSSAVYRYFPSRDELLTALITEAYDELGAALEVADAAVPADAVAARLRAVCLALRAWSVAHPHEYALLYGSPVPGYAAPDTTTPAAGRVTGVLMTLAEASERADHVMAPTVPADPSERDALGGIRALLPLEVSDERLVRWLMAWALLFGHLSLELFGHMHRGILDYDRHFRQVVEQLVRDLGLTGDAA